MRDRLIRLIDGFVFGTQIAINSIEWDSDKVKELADHLIANGVICPPCKLGDTVYRVITMGTGVHSKCIQKKIKRVLLRSKRSL